MVEFQRRNGRSYTKSRDVEMPYSMRRSYTKISCREINRKKKNKNT
jgi:hypothetical protein